MAFQEGLCLQRLYQWKGDPCEHGDVQSLQNDSQCTLCIYMSLLAEAWCQVSLNYQLAG